MRITPLLILLLILPCALFSQGIGEVSKGNGVINVPIASVAPPSVGQGLKWNGTEWTPSADLSGSGSVQGFSFPAQITATQNDYSPTNFLTKSDFVVSGDNHRTITGLNATSITDGETRFFENSGTFPLVFSPQNTGSAAANRFASPFVLFPGKRATCKYDATNARWRVTGETPLPDNYSSFYTTSVGSMVAAEQGEWDFFFSGGGASVVANPTSGNMPSFWNLSSGTTATGYAGVFFAKFILRFAIVGTHHVEAAATVSLPTLSTAAQRYTAGICLSSTPSTANFQTNNSAGIRYNDSESPNWQGWVRSNTGVTTFIDLGVPVVVGTKYNLKTMLTKDEELLFFVNGQYKGKLTSTINATTQLGFKAAILSSVGLANKAMRVSIISAGTI